MCIEPIPRILATIWCNCCHHYHVFYDGKQQCWRKWTNSSMWFTISYIYVDVFDIWTSLISYLIFFNLFVVAYLLGFWLWGLRWWMCWSHFWILNPHFRFKMHIICWFLCWTLSFEIYNWFEIMYMGLEVVKLIIMEYDHEVLMPLLAIVYKGFTPTLFVAKPLDVGLPNWVVFGALVWIKEVPMELLRIELLF